jgi:hypothetical protein
MHSPINFRLGGTGWRESRRWAGDRKLIILIERLPVSGLLTKRSVAFRWNHIGPSFNQDDFRANIDALVDPKLGGVGFSESLKDLGYVRSAFF